MGIRHRRLYVSLSYAPSKNVSPLFNGVTKLISPALSSCVHLILSNIFQSQNHTHEILKEGGDINELQCPLILKKKGAVQFFFALCRRLSLLLKATEGVLNTVC